MICQSCYLITRGNICIGCYRKLRAAPERILPNGLRSVSVLEHTGPAATLMHGLKYRGNEALLGIIAPDLERLLPPGRTYVPVPRVWTRYLRYGIDPARRIAELLAEATNGRVVGLIERPIHNRRRAGSAHRGLPPRFAMSSRRAEPVVLVDDVLTTGTTLMAAAAAIRPVEIEFVFTATAARRLFPLTKSGV